MPLGHQGPRGSPGHQEGLWSPEASWRVMECQEPGEKLCSSCACPLLLGQAGLPPSLAAAAQGLVWGKLTREEGGDWFLLTPSLWHMAPPPASGCASGSPFSMAT